MAASIRPRHDFTPQEIDALEDRLYEHNRDATGYDDGRGLGFEATDEDGKQIGAVAGHTWGGVAYIGQMWVDPEHRGEGLGAKLLEQAIAEATARKCRRMFLMTYDFQAPWLYEAHGFERVAELPDWPDGRTHIVMRRALG